jgi:hypothetical protein
MSPAFLVNYVTRQRQITNVKVDSLKYFFRKKLYACTTVLYIYMNLLRNDVYNLLINMHMRIKIYWVFYHSIIYIANEGRHVRIMYKHLLPRLLSSTNTTLNSL